MNIDIQNDAGFSSYVIALIVSGLVCLLLGAATVRNVSRGLRIWTVILGTGLLGYGVYLAFIVPGGIDRIYLLFYAFIQLVLLILTIDRTVNASRQRRPARRFSLLGKAAIALAAVVMVFVLLVVGSLIASNISHANAVRAVRHELTATSQRVLNEVVAALRSGPTTYEQVRAFGMTAQPLLSVGAIYSPGQLVVTVTGVEVASDGWFGTHVFVCTQTTIQLPAPSQAPTAGSIPCNGLVAPGAPPPTGIIPSS